MGTGTVVPWGELGLGAMALLAMAWALVQTVKNKSEKKESQGTALTSETLVAVVVAAVSTAMAEVTKPITEAVTNNTAAINHLEVSLTRQYGKLENVLSNTDKLLQAKLTGGGDEC